MSLSALENLARVGQLKVEARNDVEVGRMLAMARIRVSDSKLSKLSTEGRFSSAYSAAHAAALAALRWHGYRSENRYTVFQCLTHTVGWSAPRWRVLDAAHRQRNLAEYEGFVEFEESAIDELRTLAQELISAVAALTGM
jgi:hypothetical protein